MQLLHLGSPDRYSELESSFRAEQLYLQFCTEFKSRGLRLSSSKISFSPQPTLLRFCCAVPAHPSSLWHGSCLGLSRVKDAHECQEAQSFPCFFLAPLTNNYTPKKKKMPQLAANQLIKHWDRDQWDGWVGREDCCQVCQVNWIPGTHMVYRQNWFPQVVLWPPYMCYIAHVSVHINKFKKYNNTI